MPETDHFAEYLLDAWNHHDVASIAAFYADDYEGMDVSQAGRYRGPGGVAQAARKLFESFPDFNITVREIIAQEDRLAVMWSAQGTHNGRYMNIPATGKPIGISGASFFTIANGKISRDTHVWDLAGLLRAIGLLPDL